MSGFFENNDKSEVEENLQEAVLNNDTYVEEKINEENVEEVEISKFFPWRRYFARGLDIAIYSIMYSIVIIIALNFETVSTSFAILLLFGVPIVMFIVEPILISKTGTTFGKFVWGIRVVGENNELLTYKNALIRTIYVYIFGLGLNFQLTLFICLWLSWNKYSSGKSLRWEAKSQSKSVLLVKYSWRIIMHIIICLTIGFFIAPMLSNLIEQI